MTPGSINKNDSSTSAVEPMPVEKLRRSLRRRLHTQLQKLCTDFFDEVDDFLFASGRQGQFADDCVYLKSMRELRSKQKLFEETLLLSISRILKTGESMASSAGKATGRLGSSGAVFEEVEIDLALQAMQRKANKFYLPFISQIDSINEKLRHSPKAQIIASDVLLESTLAAFSEAQGVFTLGLDIRLVFIKLFEQKFLMKMEKLFLDIIDSLENVSDELFVVNPDSAAASSRPQLPSADQIRAPVVKVDWGISARSAQESATVELAVDNWIRKTCSQRKLPFFVEKMIRTKWRAIMFLIGLNRGITSTEWSEAKQSISLLITATASESPGQPAHSGLELEAMKAEIRQGFGLIQLGKVEQDQFFQELGTQLDVEGCVAESGGFKEKSPNNETNNASIESIICPSGKKVLDKDDLDEIAKLMGTVQSEPNHTLIEKG